MLQKLWEIKLEWDESIPIEVATVWNKYKEQIKILNNFTIPRLVIGKNVTDIQLHCFYDASESAYGAALYTCDLQIFQRSIWFDLFKNCDANEKIIFTSARIVRSSPPWKVVWNYHQITHDWFG